MFLVQCHSIQTITTARIDVHNSGGQVTVPVPRSSFVRRWAVGVLGIWEGRDSWVKGG